MVFGVCGGGEGVPALGVCDCTCVGIPQGCASCAVRCAVRCAVHRGTHGRQGAARRGPTVYTTDTLTLFDNFTLGNLRVLVCVSLGCALGTVALCVPHWGACVLVWIPCRVQLHEESVCGALLLSVASCRCVARSAVCTVLSAASQGTVCCREHDVHTCRHACDVSVGGWVSGSTGVLSCCVWVCAVAPAS